MYAFAMSALLALSQVVAIPQGSEIPFYRAQLYHVTDCPQDPVGDRFLGLDSLLTLMGRQGLKLYESQNHSLCGGPKGIIAPSDVVVIKINYQWDERGGTNTDLLRGLIRRIVDHPDGFNGEVIVCENAQFNSTSNFDRPLNNAQVHSLSPHDVVAHFSGLGYQVNHFDWTPVRGVSVNEYSGGDMSDGYVVLPYASHLQGRVSYPKFQSDSGRYVSLKYGIWDTRTQTYDRSRLKFINLPVFKSHHATYGATGAVKHYMGVVTGSLSTNSHSAIRNGILGAQLGEIQLADLNILDCIWINANPYDGPWTSYAGATRRDELLASLDPVALDLWSVKSILIPAFIANGYSPPWPSPSADPDNPNSDFRRYLDNSMDEILAAGYQVTNDLNKIDVYAAVAGGGDFDGDGDVDLDDANAFALCFSGPGGGVGSGCTAGDLDGDGDVDCADWTLFKFMWTAAGSPPAFSPCDVSAPIPAVPQIGTALLALLLLLAGGGVLMARRRLLRRAA